MKSVSPALLVPMDMFCGEEPLAVDLAYAVADHPENIFGRIYRGDARLWSHIDLARVIILTARSLHAEFGYMLELKDSLRTVDAQEAMQETPVVKANPHWCAEGPARLLAPPGHGGHPRGMAVDVCVLDRDGAPVDMGTKFDHMEPNAARSYTGFNEKILQNRKNLESAFVSSAKTLDLPLLPLPSEWWDFRFPADTYTQYAPLRDADLPPQMQMTGQQDSGIPDFPETHFDKLKETLLNSLPS
ncbi:MAG: D-Ala-D-Ala dipeptidase [Rhodospirillales bacterium]|nr:MAG: D-Ala-D-Ala dipeptidase [Rhodospirillales bacterium]